MNKRKRRLFIFFVSVLVAGVQLPGYCQTKTYEDWVVDRYFSKFIENINSHLAPILNEKEKKVVSNTKVFIDSLSTGYLVNSDSKNKTITFSKNLIKALVRYSVATLIEEKDLNFDRKRFAGFYLSIYQFISPDTYPEDAAELSVKEKKILEKVGETDEFSWTIVQKIMFIYLHELGHQNHDYTRKAKRIKSKRRLAKHADSLLLNLEYDADGYAVDKIAKMDLNPLDFEEALTFFFFIKEKTFPVAQQIVSRKVVMMKYCYNNFGCQKIQDSLCQRIQRRVDDWTQLHSFYQMLYEPKNLMNISTNALNSQNAHDLYNLADFYLKGSTDHVANIDTALFYYERIANLDINSGNLYGTRNTKQLIDIIEYSQVVSGKIYECLKEDLKKALELYSNAEQHSSFLSRNYYLRLIDRINRSSKY
jgi:hypothetical protein